MALCGAREHQQVGAASKLGEFIRPGTENRRHHAQVRIDIGCSRSDDGEKFLLDPVETAARGTGSPASTRHRGVGRRSRPGDRQPSKPSDPFDSYDYAYQHVVLLSCQG